MRLRSIAIFLIAAVAIFAVVQSGAAVLFSAPVQAVGAGPFPVAVSSGTLVDASGQPYLLVGDSPQALMNTLQLCTTGNSYSACQNSTDALPNQLTAVAYLRDRRANGFNTIMVDLFCDDYVNCPNERYSASGVQPFTAQLSGIFKGISGGSTTCPLSLPPKNVTCWDLATPNPDYFNIFDGLLQLAAQFGIQVMVDIEGSCTSADWLQTLVNNNTAGGGRLVTFANYLANRYKYPGGTGAGGNGAPNIIWQFGNDYQCYTTAVLDNVLYAFFNQLHSSDPTHLITGELSWHISSTLDDTTTAGWANMIGLNGVYTYYPAYDETIHAYKQSVTQPTFMIETYYDLGNPTGCSDETPSAMRDRRQELWALTSGSNAGYMYGNDGATEHFQTGWQNNIDTTSVTQFNNITNFVRSTAWQMLVPDLNSNLVTAGRNTYANPPVPEGVPGNSANDGECASTGYNITTNTYVSAARASDGTFAVVYMPASGATNCGTGSCTITVNTAYLGPNVTAKWFDPTAPYASAFTTICANGSGPCAPGSQTFNPSNQGLGAHSDGATDYALLLTATGPYGGTGAGPFDR
jgi:hypothetical protein